MAANDSVRASTASYAGGSRFARASRAKIEADSNTVAGVSGGEDQLLVVVSSIFAQGHEVGSDGVPSFWHFLCESESILGPSL